VQVFSPKNHIYLVIYLKYGSDANCADLWSFTPLHEAIAKRHVDLCSLLLSRKARPDLKTYYHKSGFQLALENGQLFYANFLFEFYGYALVEAIGELDLLRVKRIFAARNLHELLIEENASLFEEKASVVETSFKKFCHFRTCNTQDSLLVIKFKSIRW
jgi:hypothetical protein